MCWNNFDIQSSTCVGLYLAWKDEKIKHSVENAVFSQAEAAPIRVLLPRFHILCLDQAEAPCQPQKLVTWKDLKKNEDLRSI